MRNLICCLLLVFSVACSNAPSPEEQAAQAACGYYQHLANNEPIEFLEGKAGIDSLPNLHAEQLLQATRLYLSDMTNKHGGLREVRISDNVAKRDTLDRPVMYTFLILCFADSTQEEVVVPMVEQNGQWLMK